MEEMYSLILEPFNGINKELDKHLAIAFRKMFNADMPTLLTAIPCDFRCEDRRAMNSERLFIWCDKVFLREVTKWEVDEKGNYKYTSNLYY